MLLGVPDRLWLHNVRLLHQLGYSPVKWVHNVDEWFAGGRVDLASVPHR